MEYANGKHVSSLVSWPRSHDANKHFPLSLWGREGVSEAGQTVRLIRLNWSISKIVLIYRNQEPTNNYPLLFFLYRWAALVPSTFTTTRRSSKIFFQRGRSPESVYHPLLPPRPWYLKRSEPLIQRILETKQCDEASNTQLFAIEC